jgi:hypothetical protein
MRELILITVVLIELKRFLIEMFCKIVMLTDGTGSLSKSLACFGVYHYNTQPIYARTSYFIFELILTCMS